MRESSPVDLRLTHWGRTLAWLIAILLVPCSASAQLFNPPVRELTGPGNLELADSSARKRVALVDAYLAAEKWGEAVEGLVALEEDYPGKVIELPVPQPAGPAGAAARHYTQHVSVREYCHRRFVALPPKALDLYRTRVDPQARELFERTQASRETDAVRGQALRSIVDQFFASSWGDDALFALGDLALADGDYDLARSCWLKILPRDPQAASPPALSYPDTDLELATVHARLVLASILEGSLDRAARELKTELPGGGGTWSAPGFAARYPQATGRLAGKQGKYVEQLEGLLEAARAWPAPVPATDWPMFAGAPSRNKRMPKELDVVGQAWRRPLPAVRSPERSSGPRRVAEDRAGLLSYHPVVSGNLILTNTEDEVFAFDLVTGKPAWATGAQDGRIYPLGDGAEPVVRVARPQSVGVPRFTLTVHGHRLFARVGTPYTNLQRGIGMVTGTCSLVCLDLNAQGKLLWKLDPEEEAWSFEGSPICDGQNVYIAMRYGAVTPQAFVACYDVDTKALKWRTKICGADTLAQGALGEITHNLLTLVRGTIYFNTNLGAVAALKAKDGQLKWVTVYPRATSLDPGKSAEFTCRDLTPCVYYQGMLLVAPSDTEFLFALDAETGKLEWETDLAKDVVHLLGVSHGHLIASGDRLYWIAVNAMRRDHGGKIAFQWPDQPKSGLTARGRGVLAGPYVYWPTEEFLYVFQQRLRDTMQVGQPVRLSEFGATGGNLLATERFLLVASERELVCLSQASAQRREPLEVTVRDRPTEAEPYFHLARHDEASGRWDEAVEGYQKCLDRCGPAVLLRGRELASVARERLCQLLTERAERLANERDWLQASQRLDQAALYAPTLLAALEATLRSADLCWQGGEPARAVAHWQGLLADPRWADLEIEDASGRPVPVRTVMAGMIGKAIERLGPEVYAKQDERATAALVAARRDGKLAEVGRLAGEYPHSKLAAESLAWLARQAQAGKRWDLAAQASRGALALERDRDRRPALWSLCATAYESQGHVDAAREVWQSLAREHGDQPAARLELGDVGGEESIAGRIKARLSRAPFVRPNAETTGRALWQRRGEVTFTGQPLFPEGAAPEGRICWLAVTANKLSLVSLAPSREREGAAPLHAEGAFKLDWPAPAPIWAGFARDTLLVATRYEILGLSSATGETRWRRRLATADWATGALASPGATLRREFVLPHRRWPGVLPELAPAGPPTTASSGDEPGIISWGTLGDGEGSSFRDDLEQFVLADRLYVRQGRSRIVAIAPDTGEVEWVHVPADAMLQPQLALCGERIVLQYGPNLPPRSREALPRDARLARLVVLSAVDGRVLSDHLPTSLAPWPRAPLAFDARRILLIPDAHSVQMIDLEAGRVEWQHSGLIGESPGQEPDLLATADALVLVLSGQALSRLDPATGQKLWPRDVLLTAGGETVREPRRSLALDGAAVYGVSGGIARAYSLADGRPLWKADEYLGEKETRWRVIRVGAQLAAHPIVAPAEQPVELVLLNPADGRPIQRMPFAARADRTVVRLGMSEGLVLSADTAWLLGRRVESRPIRE